MADYRNIPGSMIGAPATDFDPITPDDDNDLPLGWCREIRCVSAGTLVGVTIDGYTRTVTLAAFEIWPVGYRRILATGTTGSYLAIY